MKNLFLTLILIILGCSVLTAKPVQTFSTEQTTTTPGLAGNGVTDIVSSNGILWFGTGHGLSRTLDNGLSFETFEPSDGIGQGSISAIWVSGDTIWVATASDTLTQTSDDYLPYGTGLSVSTNGGTTWEHFDQPGTTPIQNLSYDITVLDNIVWIASFGGGIQRSDDWGQTWQVAQPDTFLFDPGTKYNHRGFSVINADGELWVGTAGGVNKSTDNGNTWVNFNHNNQIDPISGDFVVALSFQKWQDKNIIWAATWETDKDNGFYAVSKSENGGQSWKTTLEGIKAHNFAIDDSVVYVASETGLYKSIDFGQTWYLFSSIEDYQTGEKVLTEDIFSAYAQNGILWAGTADGLARTSDNGFTWDITRAFRATGQGNEPRTYAYPNPFSPLRHNTIGDDGFVRFQYNTTRAANVTIKVFDFAMDLVKTIVENTSKSGPGDYTELWDGRNEFGDSVANGVYFYSVDIDGDGTYWGKVMIVN